MKRIYIDALILGASILFAFYIVEEGFVHKALLLAGDGVLVASFIAGFFFTSFLTTPPAIAVLGSLALEGNLFWIALFGGLGAVLGDYFLFMFVRYRVAADATELMQGPRWKRIKHIFKQRYFRRVLPILGALIIASPFPDELGLALLGISSMRTRSFFLLSLSMNALGVLLIGLLARSLG